MHHYFLSKILKVDELQGDPIEVAKAKALLAFNQVLFKKKLK